ncbi:MAG: hypothetical protein LKG26_01150 [Saccharofermentans sp.]|jgi:radical SAM superfamily enzyme YgiQ (UPF0313 family)|nr:hypothetical protein [Mageeibacillus sp.]MCI1264545.1 hypothetical protein [Saccharofermentans sp.]MCI1274693.1 hypothetical protein [Saccharofermentans sp.]MCI2044575.1 hypothetical protein [Mageeibacillus sp.]
MFGKKYRIRNAESIFSECYFMYKKYKDDKNLLDTYMSIFDDTFTVNKRRLRQFCTYMIKSDLNKNIRWKCESRIDVLDEESVKLMSQAGCIALHMGIESRSQEVVNSLNKHINLSNISNVFELLQKYSIRPLCSFIIGNHSDTHETLNMTSEFINEIRKKYNAKVAVSPNTPLPGTALYNDPQKFGISIKSNNWSDFSLMKVIIETSNLTQDEIRNYYTDIINIIDNEGDK